jgi:hypothetical protein
MNETGKRSNGSGDEEMVDKIEYSTKCVALLKSCGYDMTLIPRSEKAKTILSFYPDEEEDGISYDVFPETEDEIVVFTETYSEITEDRLKGYREAVDILKKCGFDACESGDNDYGLCLYTERISLLFEKGKAVIEILGPETGPCHECNAVTFVKHNRTGDRKFCHSCMKKKRRE